MVQDGFAWVFHKYCDKSRCVKWNGLEKIARNQEIGLWSQSNPIPPWEWRDGVRHGSSGQAVSDRDCSDSDTHAEAQRFFEAHQPGDPHSLDGDGDGVACEGLR
mgnify:CR=1 FL=1